MIHALSHPLPTRVILATQPGIASWVLGRCDSGPQGQDLYDTKERVRNVYSQNPSSGGLVALEKEQVLFGFLWKIVAADHAAIKLPEQTLFSVNQGE